MEEIQRYGQERTLPSILFRTCVIYTLGVFHFLLFDHLTTSPKKHACRLHRPITFALLPAVAIAQIVRDTGNAVHRSTKSTRSAKRKTRHHYMSDNLFVPIIGNRRDTSANEEALSLDAESAQVVHVSQLRWTWRRVGQIVFSILALTHAIGTIILFVRRANNLSEYRSRWSYGSCIGLDVQHFWMAISTGISSIAHLLRLLFRSEFLIEVDAEIARQSEPYGALAPNIILASVIQEGASALFVQVENYHQWPAYPISWVRMIGNVLPYRAFDWVLLIAALALFVLFRAEIQAPVQTSIKSLREPLVALVLVWIALDVAGLLVKDLVELVQLGDASMSWAWWQDPVSDRVWVL